MEDHQHQRITEIAEAVSLPKSQIVRWAIDSFIEQVDGKNDKTPGPILMIQAGLR